MRTYLAGRYGRFDELNEYKRQLEVRGHIVTSQWLVRPHDQSDDGVGPGIPYVDRRIAIEDKYAIENSELFILFTDLETPRGGREVEFGLAHNWVNRIMIVGPRVNVFHSLPGVEVFEAWEAAREAIGKTPQSKEPA